MNMFQHINDIADDQSLTSSQIEYARQLVLMYGQDSRAYQILNPGINLWFSTQTDAVVGYVFTKAFCVVAGSPICAQDSLELVVQEFEHYIKKHGKKVCYFGASQALIDILSHRGSIDQVMLGAEPIWDPEQWSNTLMHKPSLRAKLAKLKRKGFIVERCATHQPGQMKVMRSLLRQWLQSRKLPAMHFLVEPERLNHSYDRRVYLMKKEGLIVGFLVMSPVPVENGWVVENIIRANNAPNGVSELLLDAVMNDLRIEKVSFVTLGLSPLSERSGFKQTAKSKTMKLFLRAIRNHGQQLYNFDGIDSFKAKFLPKRWEPVYAVTGEKKVSVRAAYAIARAFSGCSPAVFILIGIIRTIVREVISIW